MENKNNNSTLKFSNFIDNKSPPNPHSLFNSSINTFGQLKPKDGYKKCKSIYIKTYKITYLTYLLFLQFPGKQVQGI
jgi:hypothetical protein